jgi:hypothetical protein
MHADSPVIARVVTTMLHPEDGTAPPACTLTTWLTLSTRSLDL